MRAKLIPFIALLAVLSACATKTPRKIAADTLFSVHATTDAALAVYLDGVIAGRIKTNGVPAVLNAYSAFQANFHLAVGALSLGTNGLAPADVLVNSKVVIFEINSATKGP